MAKAGKVAHCCCGRGPGHCGRICDCLSQGCGKGPKARGNRVYGWRVFVSGKAAVAAGLPEPWLRTTRSWMRLWRV